MWMHGEVGDTGEGRQLALGNDVFERQESPREVGVSTFPLVADSPSISTMEERQLRVK